MREQRIGIKGDRSYELVELRCPEERLLLLLAGRPLSLSQAIPKAICTRASANTIVRILITTEFPSRANEVASCQNMDIVSHETFYWRGIARGEDCRT